MVGQNIKNYLKENGITQAYLSKKTNIPQNILSDRLNGKSALRADELFLIADTLGVKLEVFRVNSTSEPKSA